MGLAHALPQPILNHMKFEDEKHHYTLSALDKRSA